MIRRFLQKIGICIGFMAKLLGVYEGLQLAISLGFKAIELNIDSQLVKVINFNINSSSIGMSLISKIKTLISHDKYVIVKHVHMEANSCADALVKNDIKLQEEYLLFDVCPFVNTFLKVIC